MIETREAFRARAGGALLGRLEALLSRSSGRCNLMRVKTPAQAAAILRGDAGDRAPDLLLIRASRGDSRASELCQAIRADGGLRATRFLLIADDGAAEADGAEFPELEVRASLGDPAFWWVAVSFS